MSHNLLLRFHKIKEVLMDISCVLLGYHAVGGLWHCGDHTHQCCWLSNKVKHFPFVYCPALFGLVFD